MAQISAPHAAVPASATPQMEPDILPGFLSETIALRPDDEGEVVATLVMRRAPVATDKAVLYVHGYSDYFFNVELADRYNEQGFDFYAIDLRTTGRRRGFESRRSPSLSLQNTIF